MNPSLYKAGRDGELGIWRRFGGGEIGAGETKVTSPNPEKIREKTPIKEEFRKSVHTRFAVKKDEGKANAGGGGWVVVVGWGALTGTSDDGEEVDGSTDKRQTV